jgi:hypothetical protein
MPCRTYKLTREMMGVTEGEDGARTSMVLPAGAVVEMIEEQWDAQPAPCMITVRCGDCRIHLFKVDLAERSTEVTWEEVRLQSGIGPRS